MKKIFLIVLCITPLFCIAQSTESPCNRHYEAAIKFIVDTPVVHPFSVSRTGNVVHKVIFSSGNLQYCPSYQHLVTDANGVTRLETIKDVFRFAPRQIDRCTDGRDVAPCNGNVYHTWYEETAGGSGIFTPHTEKSQSVKANNIELGPNYHGWIDLFNWGTSCQGQRANDPVKGYYKPYDYGKNETGDATNPKGYGPSNKTNIDTNSGANRYFDWGYANIIQEYKTTKDAVTGVAKVDSTCYRPGVWRTLTSAEWQYLLNTKTDGTEQTSVANGGRTVENSTAVWTLCSIEDPTITTTGNEKYIAGILLYPDDFDTQKCGTRKLDRRNYVNGSGNGDKCHEAKNKVSWADFQKFEESGCVFLPSCYGRDYPDGTLVGTDKYFWCWYWSASAHENDASNAYDLDFCLHTNGGGSLYTANTHNRSCGMAVRLVQDL